jgi:hypothetical protein
MVVNKTFRLMKGQTMNLPTRDEIRAAYRQGEEEIIQLVEQLIQELQAQHRIV